MIQRETANAKAEECLGDLLNFVATFGSNLDRRIRVGLPSCWDMLGGLISWEQYHQMLVEAKRKAYSSHENTATLKGKTIVKFLTRDFQLLWLVKTLFADKPNHTKLSNLKVAYQNFSLLCQTQYCGKSVIILLIHLKFE